MIKDINNVVIVGRLVRDPDIRYTSSGTAITKFSIASGERIKEGNEWKDYTNYFDIVVWGNKAVNCEKFLRKGSQVAVQGSLRQNRWTDDKTQQSRTKVEIVAESVQFLTHSVNKSEAKSKNTTDGIIDDPWAMQWQDKGDSSWDSIPEF